MSNVMKDWGCVGRSWRIDNCPDRKSVGGAQPRGGCSPRLHHLRGTARRNRLAVRIACGNRARRVAARRSFRHECRREAVRPGAATNAWNPTRRNSLTDIPVRRAGSVCNAAPEPRRPQAAGAEVVERVRRERQRLYRRVTKPAPWNLLSRLLATGWEAGLAPSDYRLSASACRATPQLNFLSQPSSGDAALREGLVYAPWYSIAAQQTFPLPLC